MDLRFAKVALFACCLVLCGIGLGACVRHGCVRTSDCSSKFECVDGRCAPRALGDGAVSSGTGGDGGSNGEAASGTGGSEAAATIDAGVDAGKPKDGGPEHG